jgi:hypothetical protein
MMDKLDTEQAIPQSSSPPAGKKRRVGIPRDDG